MIQLPAGFDSIFRYIVVVSQRAEQLVNGAKPRSESRHHKSTLMAVDEVLEGKVEWRILTQAELDAQRQAIVDQLRAEVGVTDADDAGVMPIPDVLPTGDIAAAVGMVARAGAEGEKDDELIRLQKLLGMAGGARSIAGDFDDDLDSADDDFDEPEEEFDEPVTIDLDEAADELDGSADDDRDEED
jgi:DNA-directed RNA polymerase subunit K/omega